MRYSHLNGWTPIAYESRPEPTVVWADLRGHRFEQAPFREIFATWHAADAPASPVVRTGLIALTALDDQSSLDPDLIIAHPSRCGSTLLACLAASADRTLLISEPPVLADLLQHHLAMDLGRPVDQLLREVIRAFGRIRFHDEQRYVLKLNSQTTRFLPAIRKAFPKVPLIWLQRQPAEIIESNLHCPANQPRGIPAERAVRRVTLAFMAAHAFIDERVHVLDYRDLPDAAWARLAQIMHFDPATNVGRMRETMRVDPKTHKPFVRRVREPLSDAIQAIIRQTLDPIYEDLALQRCV